MQKVLTLKNVCKSFPGIQALDNISFEVGKGEVHGFLGPNGAGKSTTMRIISGLLHADSGELSIDSSLKIGILPEIPPLYFEMSVERYLIFVFDIQTFSDLSHKEKIKKVNEVMGKTGLLDVKKRLIGNLSKGFKQRVGIASTLVFDPDLILLDEPTSGLDPKSIIEIRDLILDLKKEHTVFLSSHRLHELDLLCSEITIINKGKILTSGKVEAIRKLFSRKNSVEVELEGDAKRVASLLGDHLKLEVHLDQNKISVSLPSERRSELSRFILENGGVILSMQEKKMELEDIFRSITENEP